MPILRLWKALWLAVQAIVSVRKVPGWNTRVSEVVLSSQAGEGVVGLFSGQSMGKGSGNVQVEGDRQPWSPRRNPLPLAFHTALVSTRDQLPT